MIQHLIDNVLWYLNFLFASGLCWWVIGYCWYYNRLVRSLSPTVKSSGVIDPSTFSLEELQHYEKLISAYGLRGPLLMLNYLADKEKAALKLKAQKKIWQRELRRAKKHVK